MNTATPAAGRPARVLIDGHVHLHPVFEIGRALERARANLEGDAPGWLLLADMPGKSAFDRLLEVGRNGPSAWTVETGGEPAALHALKAGRLALIVIAGRQIGTREGLEVLAIGTRTPLADGLPLDETLARVRAADAVPVLPWGFGKWWGKRGALVDRVLERDDEPFCLGDNGGRLQHGLPPRAFGRAQEHGIPVLPGSDPLALPDEINKLGRYGFVLEGLDPERPATSLKQRLRTLVQPEVFGRREWLWRFCRNQAVMQIRKRRQA